MLIEIVIFSLPEMILLNSVVDIL